VNPAREKSILYTFSIMMMHAPAAAKCLGEEKTMCNLQKESMNHELLHNIQNVPNAIHYIIYNTELQNPNIIQSIPDQF